MYVTPGIGGNVRSTNVPRGIGTPFSFSGAAPATDRKTS
jgi:hypothetical protein